MDGLLRGPGVDGVCLHAIDGDSTRRRAGNTHCAWTVNDLTPIVAALEIDSKPFFGPVRRGVATSTPSMRRVRRSTAPEWLAGCNGCLLFCVRRGAGPKGGRHRYPASVRRPSRTASVFGHRCGSLDSIALAAAHGRVLFQSARCSATFRFSRFRLKVDQRTPHGPHGCALSLTRAAVARSSVAHATLGWHAAALSAAGLRGHT